MKRAEPTASFQNATEIKQNDITLVYDLRARRFTIYNIGNII